MKRRVIGPGLLVLALVLSVAVAADYESIDPPITACSFLCRPEPVHHTVEALEFTGTDWNEAEKIALDTGYAETWGDTISIPVAKTATKVYNCHAYAFGRTSVWIQDPGNFYCTNSDEDHRGGYKTWDDPGTKIYRFDGDNKHSARAGAAPWPYKGKLGDGPIANHNTETKYGSHSAVWEHRSYPDCGQQGE